MRAAADAKYCLAPGVVIAEPRLILAVDLEFPGALPSIFRRTAGRRCRIRQPEPRYSDNDSKQPCMRRHGKPPTRSAIILTQECVSTSLPGKGSADVGPHTFGALGRPHGSLTCIRGPAPMSAFGKKRTFLDVCYLSAFGAKRTCRDRRGLSIRRD